MRRWFEIGNPNGGPVYTRKTGDKQFHQLPQIDNYLKFVNSLDCQVMVLNNGGNGAQCVGDVNNPHVYVPNGTTLLVGNQTHLQDLILYQGVPPASQPLIRQYFEKPGVNDGPNITQTVEPKPKTHAAGDFGGAPGLFSFAQNLGLVARAILALRNPVGGKTYASRVAGIVLEIQQNIFKLRITVVTGSNQFHNLVLANQALFEQIQT